MRLRHAEEFDRAFRGVRGGSQHVHVAISSVNDSADLHGVKVGFIVSKKVGNSVVRHRTVRRLRHIMRMRYQQLPSACLCVVLARPSAGQCSFSDLEKSVDQALKRSLRAREKSTKSFSNTQGE